MKTPTQDQLNAAFAAAKQAIYNYSAFDASMVPDDALMTVVTQALTAALNVQEQSKETT